MDISQCKDEADSCQRSLLEKHSTVVQHLLDSMSMNFLIHPPIFFSFLYFKLPSAMEEHE